MHRTFNNDKSSAPWASYDDVIIWKHFPRYWPFVRGIHRSPVNSPHKGQWRGALMFSLICVWINDRVNGHEAGGLRRYYPHYDVTVMSLHLLQLFIFMNFVLRPSGVLLKWQLYTRSSMILLSLDINAPNKLLNLLTRLPRMCGNPTTKGDKYCMVTEYSSDCFLLGDINILNEVVSNIPYLAFIKRTAIRIK